MTFWHALGDFQSKSLQIWHIWTFELMFLRLSVSDAFCWLSNIYIFDKLLNFDLSNINVMRVIIIKESNVINDVFVSIFLKIYRALMRWTPFLEFFGGQVAMMSPHDGGTHLEWGVEGRGIRALSQILSDVSLSYSLKHISTGEHSLHISCRITHLLHLYFLFSWWRH